MNNLYIFLLDTANALSGGLIFTIAVALQLGLLLTVILIVALARLYSLKKRVWYFIFSLAILALERAMLSLANQVELYYLTLGLTLAFWGVVALLPERKLTVTKEQRDFAKLINEKANAVGDMPLQPPVSYERPLEQPIKPQRQVEEASRFELDFQHVKTVTQKLEYYPLSVSDKKVVKDLEDNIYTAETEGLSPILKSKINDGLGALLKIMSKHGV